MLLLEVGLVLPLLKWHLVYWNDLQNMPAIGYLAYRSCKHILLVLVIC